MEIRTRDEEREYLLKLIFEWNASRLDIFEISQPDENLEYKGVMRFFFQDSGTKDTKVATKCVRVSSRDTTDDVLKILVEKFRPDMKMLTNPEYRLYEVHPNGEARQLTKIEHPLKVQLEWQKEDREGRFLLKSSKDKVVHSSLFATAGSTTNTNQNFKRRLSKREKKELKKKQQEDAKKIKSNDDTAIAQNLYEELPETSFTRSISNPEAVMRRRRQQKLEKRLKEFQDKEGSDSGGTLKIFAETLKPEIPYKTLLVGMRDSASYVVKEALDKYQMTKEEPEDYCLVMVNVPIGGQTGTGVLGKERVVHDSDCPLAVATTWPSNRGTIVFHLRRRANLPRYRKEKRTRSRSPARVPMDVPADRTAAERLAQPSSVPQHLLPYLAELSPDGYELEHKPQILRLQMNLTEIGSEKSPSPKANHILLYGPNVLHRHCVVTNNDGRVSITPSSSDAEILVNNKRIKEMTELYHGNVVRLGKLLLFRFFDPVFQNSKKRHSAPGFPSTDSASISSNSTIGAEKSQSGNTYVSNRHSEPVVFPMIHDQISVSSGLGSSMNQSTVKDHSSVSTVDEDMDTDQLLGTMYETTFDVDGDIKTITSTGPRMSDSEMQPSYAQELSPLQIARSPLEVRHDDVDDSLMDKLPATLEFRESGEDAFFAAVVSEVNGAAVHFKLAPTYTLYMCCRYRISPWYKRELPPQQRSERLGVTVLKIANMVQSTVRENSQMPGSLAFWMANASELLHFLKMDRDTAAFCRDGKQILAQSVQLAFRHLVQCIQYELRLSMPAFFDETDEADQEDSDFESMLDNDGGETLMGGERSFSIQHNRFGRPLSNDNLLGTRRRNGSRPSISDILYTLSSAMSLLRRCRVNAALTIQVFSQLFHFINMWLFNKLVLEPQLGLCTRDWGRKLIKRLGRVDSWAEKQGLELASDCHLCRVTQAAHLLQSPKSSAKDIADISSTCFKLNSIQLRALLQHYRPAHDERIISQELIESVAAVAENTADELMRSSGQEVQLEEDPELQLPFLLPEDGYSDEVIRGVPPGLKEFLDPLCSTGLCRLTVQPNSSGMWTVYRENFKEMGDHPSPLLQTPEIIDVSFNKGRGGMGISIVAAKAAGQDQLGIYIKQVVKEGPAAKDGRLQAGDHILFVNGESLIGVSQEKAAECLVKAGNVVQLRVAKQGAIHHGLATLLSQPAPIVTREPPRSPQASPTLPDHEIQRSPGRWLSDGRSARVPDEMQYDDRRRRVEEEEQWRIEEERRREQEEEKRRQEEEEERRRYEEERKRVEDEKRIEEGRKREEIRKKEEEQRRVEAERRWEEERMLEDKRRFTAEQQRIEEERRREKQLYLEEQHRLEEDRRRLEQRRFTDEPRHLSEEQRRVEQERRQAEERMRVIGEQQKQQRKKKRIRFEDEDEEEMTALQTRLGQQPPRSPYKVKFETEEIRPVDSAQAPRPTDVPVPADLDSHEMPAYTIKFQKAPSQPSPAEPEVNVRESDSLYASPFTRPYANNRFQREVSPESIHPGSTSEAERPTSPARLDSRDTRYGRAIVITKGMVAQRPAALQRPKAQDHDRLAQHLVEQDKERREREQQERQQRERDEYDEFQRWQLQEKQMAEDRERQLARNEQQEKDEFERLQQQRRERDEQRQREAAEKERQERVLQEQEERLRREQERRERECRDRERLEMIERQRREREQKEREQEVLRKQEQGEKRFVERQQRGSTELLDKIETMSADEVEREFKRRLDEENRRREIGEADNGVTSEKSAAGLVSVTRVQYVSPEREEQLEREHKLNLIIGEKEKRDRENKEVEVRRRAQEERNERERRDRQHYRMAQLEKEREQQREVQKRVQEQRDREQEDWLQQQREKREQQRLEQERMRMENKLKEEEEEKRKRLELMQKREQEEALRRTYQVQREQEQERLLREQRGEAARREEERHRQLEQKKLLREKDEELRRQQAGEQPRSRVSSDEYHINELKEKAMIDYERRRILIDEEIQQRRGNAARSRYDEPQEQCGQRSTNSLLKTSNTNSLTKTKKQVSFSNVTTEITEPSAPTYVVGTASGYTAIVTPAPSVRLVPSRIPDDDDPPPYNRPPLPEDDEDDLPPPPPPPPPPELLDDDIAFPAPPPPQSSNYGSSPFDDGRYNNRTSSNESRVTASSTNSVPHDPRSPHGPRSLRHSYGVDVMFQQEVPLPNPHSPHSPAQFQRPPPPTSSQDYTSYVTWPRKGRPVSYPTRQDEPPPKSRYASQDSLDDRVPQSGSYSRAQLAPRPWRGSNENMLKNPAEDVRGRVARISLADEEISRDKPSPIPKPEKLNFRDKQKLFNDGTPQDKSHLSRWEKEQSRQVNGDVTSP